MAKGGFGFAKEVDHGEAIQFEGSGGYTTGALEGLLQAWKTLSAGVGADEIEGGGAQDFQTELQGPVDLVGLEIADEEFVLQVGPARRIEEEPFQQRQGAFVAAAQEVLIGQHLRHSLGLRSVEGISAEEASGMPEEKRRERNWGRGTG